MTSDKTLDTASAAQGKCAGKIEPKNVIQCGRGRVERGRRSDKVRWSTKIKPNHSLFAATTSK